MTMEELAVILGVKDKWYEVKRGKEEWFLGFPNLVVGGTNGWSDRECVWFHEGKKLHFLEPYLIDDLWNLWADEVSDRVKDFDDWLNTMEGHAEIEVVLYLMLESAEDDAEKGNKNKYVYVEG